MELQTIIKGSILIILLVFIPGLALTLAVFPRKKDLNAIERLGIIFVLGLTPQFILYFINKNMSIPADAMSTSMSILIVTVVGFAVWILRARSGGAEESGAARKSIQPKAAIQK